MPEVAKKVVSEEKVPIFVPEEEEEEFIPEEIVPEKGTRSFLASHLWHLLCSLKFISISCSKFYVTLVYVLRKFVVCSMFLSCFHVHAFIVSKAILTRVCKIISLKSQRFLRNLSKRKKHLYLHLRNWNFLQQKVHKLTMCCYSHSVFLFSLFVIYVSFVSLLHFCIGISECLSNS